MCSHSLNFPHLPALTDAAKSNLKPCLYCDIHGKLLVAQRYTNFNDCHIKTLEKITHSFDGESLGEKGVGVPLDSLTFFLPPFDLSQHNFYFSTIEH